MRKTVSLIEIEQPIGTFYIGKMKSQDLFKIAIVETRENGKGVQREESIKRIGDIARYCEDPDAAFPTPIIMSVNSKVCDIRKLNEVVNFTQQKDDLDISISDMSNLVLVSYDEAELKAEILDGQHRLKGIEKAGFEELELPIVLMFDLTEEEKAYVFSTINSNQTKVSKSLIYDLFELSEKPSPYKTCHEIARILNSKTDSPFYGKLKMLGKKTGEASVLSQGSFVNYLATLISDNPQRDMILFKKGTIPESNPKFPFREYFLHGRDDIILKIVEMFFSAVQSVFPDEWDKEGYILSKTTGYAAMILVLKNVYFKAVEQRDLSKDFFEKCLVDGKQKLLEDKKELTSKDFPSNAQNQQKLANYFLA